AGITQPMGDVARGHEGIAGPENEALVSNDDLQLSGKDEVPFVLARMRVPWHTHPGRETHLQQAVCTCGIRARQAYRTDAHVEIATRGPRLVLDRRGSARKGLNVEHVMTPCFYCRVAAHGGRSRSTLHRFRSARLAQKTRKREVSVGVYRVRVS